MSRALTSTAESRERVQVVYVNGIYTSSDGIEDDLDDYANGAAYTLGRFLRPLLEETPESRASNIDWTAIYNPTVLAELRTWQAAHSYRPHCANGHSRLFIRGRRMQRVRSPKDAVLISWFSASALATLTLAVSCGGQQSRDPYAGDTTYQRRLAYQQQMSYRVPTDSQVHLYQRLAAASPVEAAPLAREIMCEMDRSATRFGAIPAAAAGSRAMRAFRQAEPEVYARARTKFNNVSPIDLSTNRKDCHLDGITRAPDSLNVKPVPDEIARKFRRP
jgi:hypothetical protein